MRNLIKLTAVLALVAGAMPALAGGTDAAGGPGAASGAVAGDALAQALQRRLDFAYGPVWASADAGRFVDEFMTNDAIMTGADGPGAARGREQLVAAVGGLMKEVPLVKARAVYTKQLGRDAAFQFVVFELHAKDAEGKESVSTAKSLYVWTRTPRGWRVAADHYSFAGLDLAP
ncbi:MAG: DUF4440 domain-containing protein [Steroidobacteraceae bacterium]